MALNTYPNHAARDVVSWITSLLPKKEDHPVMVVRTYTVIRALGDGQHVIVSRCYTSEEPRRLVASLGERSPGDYAIEFSSNGSAAVSEPNYDGRPPLWRKGRVFGGFMKVCNKRVLVLENNLASASVLVQVLRDAGFDALTTWSGREALAVLSPGSFDVLVVDDYLADQHLTTFLKQVRQLSNPPSIVVMQASPPTEKQVRQYTSFGVSGVVQKHHLAELCNSVSICTAETEALLN